MPKIVELGVDPNREAHKSIAPGTPSGANSGFQQFVNYVHGSIQNMSLALEHLGIKIEALETALLKSKVVSQGDLDVAREAFIAFKAKLHELRGMSVLDRANGMLLWNAQEDQRTIPPESIDLPRLLLEDRTLPYELRKGLVEACGLGDDFMAEVRRRWGRGEPQEAEESPEEAQEE